MYAGWIIVLEGRKAEEFEQAHSGLDRPSCPPDCTVYDQNNMIGAIGFSGHRLQGLASTTMFRLGPCLLGRSGRAQHTATLFHRPVGSNSFVVRLACKPFFSRQQSRVLISLDRFERHKSDAFGDAGCHG